MPSFLVLIVNNFRCRISGQDFDNKVTIMTSHLFLVEGLLSVISKDLSYENLGPFLGIGDTIGPLNNL